MIQFQQVSPNLPNTLAEQMNEQPNEQTKPTPPKIDSWEQQPRESDVAYAAFRIFREMGSTRTQAAVGREVAKGRHLLGRWAKRWNWKARVYEFDLEEERGHLRQLRADRKAMARRHAGQFQKLQRVAMAAMKKKFGDDYNKIDDSGLTIEQMLRVLDVASKGERLALGEPDSISEQVLSGGRPEEGETDERKPIPLTFSGRMAEIGEILDAARERTDLEAGRDAD